MHIYTAFSANLNMLFKQRKALGFTSSAVVKTCTIVVMHLVQIFTYARMENGMYHDACNCD